MQQPISDAAAAAEAARAIEQQRAAIKPVVHPATGPAASSTAASLSADPSSGSKRTAAVMSAKTAAAVAAAAGSTAAASAAASTTGPNKENDTQMETKSASKPVSPLALISVPPPLLPAPTAQSAVVSAEIAPSSSQLCSEQLGGSEDPAERVAAESKRRRKSRGELSDDPQDWTEQIARNQATVKELNSVLEVQRQVNTAIERSLRRAHRLVAWAIAQAERQVNNETQAQLLNGDGDGNEADEAAAAAAATVAAAASSSAAAAAAAVPASSPAAFTVYDREEEIFAAAIAAQDDPLALRTVPAAAYSDPAVNAHQTWSWMSLQYRMDIDARHMMLRHAKAFNASLTQELADACKWADRVAESAERSVDQMSLSEPMRGEIKLRIQQKADAMLEAVLDKERAEESAAAAGGAAAAAESSSSSAAAAAESSAASSEAASKQL